MPSWIRKFVGFLLLYFALIIAASEGVGSAF